MGQRKTSINVDVLVVLLASFCIFPNELVANFGDKDAVYDEQHLKHHLEDKLEIGEHKMTPEEERFHYFSINDLNKDHVIDGIEVWKAIHHHHSEKGELSEPPANPVTDEEVEKAVDEVMKDVDLNGDGVIDYSEYVKKVDV